MKSRTITAVLTAGVLMATLLGLPSQAAATAAPNPLPDAPVDVALGPSVPRVRSAILLGVDGVAPDDVWAVGWHSARYGAQAVAVHWNGRRWRSAHLPFMGTSTSLRGVVALASDDVWAVGAWTTPQTAKNLIMHWDGEEWTRVDAPRSDDYRDLQNVSALALDDIVASGRYCFAEQCIAQTIDWDGEEWTAVEEEPLSLVQQVGGATDDALAIGNSAPFEHPLVQHWDGTSWEDVRLPRSAPGELLLSDLSVLRSGRGWVAANARGLRDRYLLRVEWLPPQGRRSSVDGGHRPRRLRQFLGRGLDDRRGRVRGVAAHVALGWRGVVGRPEPDQRPARLPCRSSGTSPTFGPADAWAIGRLDDEEGTAKRLAMHWDGEDMDGRRRSGDR